MDDQTTLEVLQAHRTAHPASASTLDLYSALLQARAKVEIGDWKLQVGDAEARLAHGEPLLGADELVLDWNVVAALAQEICAIAARHQPDATDAFAELAREFESPARVEQLARALLAPESLASSIANHQLCSFVLVHALHPWLAAHARAYAARVSAETWQRGRCPFCGGAPDFAVFEKETGARRLLCARCDGEWTFTRAACPFCGEDAPGNLSYYPLDAGVRRLYTCGKCKRYLKTLDLRERIDPAHLPAERVLTIDMDRAAIQAGYRND